MQLITVNAIIVQKITVNAIIMQKMRKNAKKCKKCKKLPLFFKSMDGLETFVAFQVATSCKLQTLIT